MTTAKALWANLASAHSGPLQRARDCAKLTIPSLLPPEGSNDTTQMDVPYQSLGARGANNLASKLLLALFPPGSSPFRYSLVEEALEADGSQQEDRTDVEAALAKREKQIMDNVEASPQRPVLAEYLLHLVVCGNALLFYPNMDEMRMYRIDQYRIRRGGNGKPVDCVVKECVHPTTLDDEVRKTCEVKGDEQEVEVYTKIEWRKGRVTYCQEINDIEVPGSKGSAPASASPWIPGRWKAVPGNHYGRGHVEEMQGDLISYEGCCQAIVQFASVAARIIILKHPSATTNIEDINNAESGDAVTGSLEDLDVLHFAEKTQDFRVVQATAEKLEERLSYAFLLRSGATRDAERVTAEEIRALAQELEDVHGGVYTVQSQELQLPWVNRTVLNLERERKIATLPKGMVRPVIVTGFQALGRNHALNKVRGFVADLANTLTPQGALSVLKIGNLSKRLGIGWGVEDLMELIKTDDEVAQERAAQQQAGMASELMSKAAGPVAAAVAKGEMQLPTQQ